MDGGSALPPRQPVHGRPPPIGVREGVFSALAAAVLFAAGATLALVAVALPHPAAVDEQGASSSRLRPPTRRPPSCWGSPEAESRCSTCAWPTSCGTALVTCCVLFTASKPSPYALLYIWVRLYGFYFVSHEAGVSSRPR